MSDDKPTSSTILDFAKRHGVSVPFVYKMAQRKREYDADVAAGLSPEGPRPIAPRIVKMGRCSKITDSDERLYIDEIRADADNNPGRLGKGGRPRKTRTDGGAK